MQSCAKLPQLQGALRKSSGNFDNTDYLQGRPPLLLETRRGAWRTRLLNAKNYASDGVSVSVDTRALSVMVRIATTDFGYNQKRIK